MKKYLFLILVVVFTLLAFSCPTDEIEPVFGNFWAINLRTDRPYRVNADLMAEGIYCKVWAEKGSGITKAKAKEIADEFDDNIYEKMINAFGIEIDYDMIIGAFGEENVSGIEKNEKFNTMEFADVLGDGDGKLCILLLDIKDNYKEGVNDSYTAGYFWSGDFLSVYGSNSRDMIYIDTNPGMQTPDTIDKAFTTLAHEMQHLMNFVTNYVKRSEKKGNTIYIHSMDTWIDEGLSSAAEWIYSSVHTDFNWKWYNLSNDYGLIYKGNNFFIWGNRGNESQYAILDDYATVYMFFQWLRLQSGNNKIYKDIILSDKSNYTAVTTAASDNIKANYSWGDLLGDWLAANFLNEETGRFGYMNDETLKQIKAPYAPAVSSMQLFPGEGVYSYSNSAYFPNSAANIKYAGLSSSGISQSISAGDTLLTYNINTDNTKPAESGTTTGAEPPAPPSPNVSISGSRSAVNSGIPVLKGPFPIGAEGLNKEKEINFSGFTFQNTGKEK